MAAEQALPEIVSARDLYQVTDAALAERLGFKDAPAEEVKEEVVETPVEEKKEEEVVAEKEATPDLLKLPSDKAAEEVVEEAEPEPEKEPEPKKVPLTKFQLHDDKTELEVPDNIFLTFKANSKEYEKVPLDKVVQLAQMGVYNHDREQAIKAKEAAATQAAAEAAQAKELAKWYEQQYERIFMDDEFAELARQEFLKTKTPEARAARAEQELQEQRAQWQQKEADQTVAQFTNGYLVPRFQNLLQQNDTVNQYELIGRWNELTAPLMVRGRIPADKLANVQTLVESELAHWAQSIHLERSAEAAKRSKALKEAEKERLKVKRQVARAIAPPSGSPSNATPKPEKFETAKDWYKKSFAIKD